MQPDLRALGAAVSHLRQAAGMSQTELGRKAGVHRNTVGNIEGAKGRPGDETLAKIADALGLPLSALEAEAAAIETSAESATSGGGAGFPLGSTKETRSIYAHLTGALIRANGSDHEDPTQVAFEEVEATVEALRDEGRFSDSGYAYWRALRLGAFLAGGYVPGGADPTDPGLSSDEVG